MKNTRFIPSYSRALLGKDLLYKGLIVSVVDEKEREFNTVTLSSDPFLQDGSWWIYVEGAKNSAKSLCDMGVEPYSEIVDDSNLTFVLARQKDGKILKIYGTDNYRRIGMRLYNRRYFTVAVEEVVNIEIYNELDRVKKETGDEKEMV